VPNIIPGADFRPINVGRRSARRKGRAFVAHIAVSNAAILTPPSPNNPDGRSADWHGYFPKAGGFVQFIDADLTSWATRDGNGSCFATEAQGGVGDDVNGPYTDPQVESHAHVLAYLNESEGIPLDLMPDSRPTSRGMGYHRLGVDPWRVSGGELWSSARGKVCPGPTRIGQIPIIVSRARELRHGSAGSMPVAPPAVTPAPAAVPRPPVMGWPFRSLDYVGDLNGPNESHGGYYASERPFIKNVQQWLIYRGATSVHPSRWAVSTWADGKFERESIAAAEKFFAGDKNPGRIYSDDYAQLVR